MDDEIEVCPLCCEELDISDRQFFPCKCGYQVCMWCWHRIKESESGLCPACRTPYGDDPHAFSAVDMEEVVKANKEKAAAEKRERERLRHQQASALAASVGGASGGHGSGGISAGLSRSSSPDGDLPFGVSGGPSLAGRGLPDAPKDRNSLANMRVIRRNLVYAVGLPPSVATEDMLRKPEYFGQYGKISKIVLNRNHNGNGDPRRASASAYVTFVHKEDTLSCILALDGFYLDGRNIRASFGTSKYCSAFIKSVRCNNPDCTYLHCMGESDDTFTKQEIQAGYVTSGRDVYARQQQQMNTNGNTKRRVGGGGPSGTGKPCANPILPPPSFDEQPKQSTGPLAFAAALPGGGATVQPVASRPVTGSSPGFSAVAAIGTASIGIPTQKAVRSSSLTAAVSGTSGANTASGTVLSAVTAKNANGVLQSASSEKHSWQHERRQEATKGAVGNAVTSGNTNGVKAGNSKATNGTAGGGTQGATLAAAPVSPQKSNSPTPLAATAASVVAGSHNLSTGSSQPPPHKTLTSLTPLKRASSVPKNATGNLAVSKNSTNSSLLNATQSSAQPIGTDSIQLPPNMPVPKGLSPSEQATFLEQRKEAMAAMARQQRENAMKLTALRAATNNATQSSFPSQGTIVGGSGSSLATPIASLGTTSDPVKKPSEESSTPAPGVIGGRVIGGGSDIGGHSISLSVGPGVSGVIETSPELEGIGGRAPASSDVVIGAPGRRDPGVVGGVRSVGAVGERAVGSGVLNLQTRDVPGTIGGAPGDGLKSSNPFAVGGMDKWAAPTEVRAGTSSLFGGGLGIGGSSIWGNDGSQGAADPGPVAQTVMPNYPASLHPVKQENDNRPTQLNMSPGMMPSTSSVKNDAPSGNILQGGSVSSDLNSGSSALASMLGINLPTGSGSLREASSLMHAPSPPFQAHMGNIGGAAEPGPIGPKQKSSDEIIPGGNGRPFIGAPVPIGGFNQNRSGDVANESKSNRDIALLQSLLPGVTITKGTAQYPAAPLRSKSLGGVIGENGVGSLMNPLSGSEDPRGGGIPFPSNAAPIGGLGLQGPQVGTSYTWGGSGLFSAAPGGPSHNSAQHRPQQSGGNIW